MQTTEKNGDHLLVGWLAALTQELLQTCNRLQLFLQ